jgi:flavin reductase (DIM6/NTAB) family NADH-FMN oxidoreductase RutF
LFYETRQRDKSLLPRDPFKAIVAPRPIGWISTRSKGGLVNLAPYSFFNAFSSDPPIVGFSSEGAKDSSAFARDSGEFVVNLATMDLLRQMSESSAPLPRGPRVSESHAAMECKVVEIVTLKNILGEPMDNYLVLGEVVAFHIDERFVHDGVFDAAAARSLARCGYQDYAVIDRLFTLARPPGGSG